MSTNSNNKLPLIIGGVVAAVVLVVVVIVVAVVAMGSKSSTSSSSSSSSVESVTAGTSTATTSTAPADNTSSKFKKADTSEFVYYYPSDYSYDKDNEVYFNDDETVLLGIPEKDEAYENNDSDDCDISAEAYAEVFSENESPAKNVKFSQVGGANVCTFSVLDEDAELGDSISEFRMVTKGSSSYLVHLMYSTDETASVVSPAREALNMFTVK